MRSAGGSSQGNLPTNNAQACDHQKQFYTDVMLRLWQYKTFHMSYGIGMALLGSMCGLALAKLTNAHSEIHWTALLACSILILVLLPRLNIISLVIVLLAGGSIGLIRGSDYAYQLNQLAKYEGKSVTAHGVVREDPQLSVRGTTRLIVGNIRINNKESVGMLWVETRDKQTLKRGDEITFRGQLKSGFGVYTLRMSSATIMQRSLTHDPMVVLRDMFSTALRRVVVEPSASLGVGFVVGQKSSLPPELEEQLRIVGLTHLVVASGYNLTILMRFAKRIFESRSKFMVGVVSVVLMLGFISISGASPSMVRAGLVAGLSLAAWYYGRAFHPVLLIIYVGGMTALWQPTYLWSDIGWWLSFLAFFGVLVVAPLLLRIIFRKHQTGALVQLVAESLAAQIMTLPLLLMVFGNLPVLAILANIVSAPLIPLAMLLTFIAGIMTMIIPFAAQLAAIPAEIILSYFVAVIRTLSQPAWARVDMSISWQTMGVIYSIVIVLASAAWYKTRYDFRSQSIID